MVLENAKRAALGWTLVILLIITSLILSSCDGMSVNVQVEPDEEGGFTITGGGEPVNGGDGANITITSDEQSDNPSLDANMVLLFGVILAIFLGVIALVVSSSQRAR